MCGIAGIYRFRSGRPVAEEEVARMSEVLAHRGPDDEGTFRDGPLGLAHRRLTILDTSRRGRQPMFTADGAIGIVYNGEVYNYLELRRDLESRGHHFRTATDTEVLLALFREKGTGFLQDLNGMFAFAIWDRTRRRLFLARDRLGIKPLYYHWTPEGIIFGSEIKAILAVLADRPGVNLEMLDAYMSVGYVPTDQTFFTGISKLSPGWSLTVDEDGVETSQYWDLRLAPAADLTEEECAERALALLEDSVRLQLRSDVPLGVFLSGGVDSSAVVALMHRLGVPEIETFTVAYRNGSAFDETVPARRVAERFGTRHHELYVSPDEFRDSMPRLIWHMEEPVTEAAAISLSHIARLARERVVVVLSGEGSDEVFGGYPIYKYMQVLEHYRRLPKPLREILINPILDLLGGKWRKYTELSRHPLERRYLGVSFYERPLKESLYRPELAASLGARSLEGLLRDLYAHTEGQDALLRMMYLDVKTWLVDDLLIKADKMTMAWGVELRVPFLDHRVVEFGATIPPRWRIKGWRTKNVLKKAMEPYLPPEIIDRSKMGFPTPLESMFRGPLRDYVGDVVTSERFASRGYFRPEVVGRLLAEHRAGTADHHRVLWQLVVLEEWHRRFVDAA